MNVLPLVFAILIILGFMTHAQMEQFKQYRATLNEYEIYMEKHVHERFNQRQEALYQAGGKKKDSEKSTVKMPSNRRLNFRLLIDKKLREKDKDKYEQHLLLAKELIKVLYQDQAFYKEMEQKKPEFIDELFQRMLEAAEKNNIKYGDEMDSLNLQDEDLQMVFLKMLEGTQKKAEKAAPIVKDDAEEEEEEEEIDEHDFQSEKAFLSIKNFFHFNHTQVQIKIYTAPKEILQAIFVEEEIANQIMNKREELFAMIKKDETEKAKEILESFRAKKRADIKDELLDFSVSKTNPTKYR
jgi:hypothetical protein